MEQGYKMAGQQGNLQEDNTYVLLVPKLFIDRVNTKHYGNLFGMSYYIKFMY